MQKYLMGIDRGTTNVKVALYQPDGKEIAVSCRNCEEVKRAGQGYAEQNMERIWQDTVAAIRGLWEQGCRPEEVIGVGLSGQGGGMFLIDRNGEPVREGIVSLDSRVTYAARKWKEDRTHQNFLELWNDGNPTTPQALFYWLKENEAGNYKKSRWILQCKDWIRYRLTGNINYEITDASNGFLLDEEYNYDLNSFDYYGISSAKIKFPELLSPWDLAGVVTMEASGETGLAAGTKVAGGGHDVAMVGLGTGCCHKDEVVCVLGTWGLNLMLIERPHAMMGHYAKVILSAVPDMYLFMNGGSTGASLDWFVDEFCATESAEAENRGISVFEVIEEKIISGENESRSKVICHPFTEPLLMMPGYENAQAGFYGMTDRTTRGQLLRAILEGIALEVTLFLEVLKKAAKNLEAVRLCGGGAKNNLLARMIADASKVKVRIPDVAEPGCRGAALSAGIAIGEYADHAEIGELSVDIKKEFVPTEEGMDYMKKKMEKSKQIAKVMEQIWNN